MNLHPDTPSAQTEQTPPLPTPADVQLPDGVRASPLARKIAQDRGIDLKLLSGSGPKGRIIKQDVEAALNAPQSAPTPEPTPIPPSLVDLGTIREDQRVPLSRLREAIGRRMVDSKQNFPHFYVTSEVDLGPLMDLRKQANTMLADSGEKLSVNDFIIKATALALRRIPQPQCRPGWRQRGAVRQYQCRHRCIRRKRTAHRGDPQRRPQICAPDFERSQN